MLITKTWLNLHRTANGSFTRAQIEELGVSYPPTRGWMRELLGTEITKKTKLQFESKSNTFSGQLNNELEKAVFLVCSRSSDLTINQKKRLRGL